MPHIVAGGALGLALVAMTAHANAVDPTKSKLQGRFLDVEGSTQGKPDGCSDGRCGAFTVTVRDFANNRAIGSTIVVDFSECTDIQLACDPLEGVTGQAVMPVKRVVGFSNASGQFTFHVQGAANATAAGAPGARVGEPCAKVYADGFLLGRVAVAAYDVNGAGSPAVNGADVSIVATEAALAALAKPAYARADYNHSGSVNGADVARAASMAGDAMLGTGSATTGPFCP